MGSVAVITGGSRGIGFGTAEHLASLGWDIALCARNDRAAEQAARRIADQHSVRTFGAGADVSDADSMKRFAESVDARFGPVRALVCNAALLGPVGRVADVPPDGMAGAFAVNVLGFSNSCRAFWPVLDTANGFRIVALAGGGLGGPGQMLGAPAYVPSKAALVSMVELVSDEVVRAGGTVNVIAPGNIPTDFMEGVLEAGPEIAGELLYTQAAERRGKDIGDSLTRFLDLLVYLCGDESGFVSGRFLSARWNDPASLAALGDGGLTDAMFRLRRIDDDLFKEAGR